MGSGVTERGEWADAIGTERGHAVRQGFSEERGLRVMGATLTRAATDAGAGADVAVGLLAALLAVEDGSAVDASVALAAALLASEEATGTDARASLEAFLDSADAGTVTDLAASLVAALQAADTGVGTDARELVANILQALDSGAGVDTVKQIIKTAVEQALHGGKPIKDVRVRWGRKMPGKQSAGFKGAAGNVKISISIKQH